MGHIHQQIDLLIFHILSQPCHAPKTAQPDSTDDRDIGLRRSASKGCDRFYIGEGGELRNKLRRVTRPAQNQDSSHNEIQQLPLSSNKSNFKILNPLLYID